MEKKRVVWMDLAKAAGLLIVLLNHAELDLGPITWLGGMFYMPVFFVLAGMTFSLREGESLAAFAKRKALRLLVPYVCYNLFLFLFFFVKDSLLTGNVTAQSFFPLLGILYSRNCLYPMTAEGNLFFMTILNAPTWFLPCLFLALVIYAAIQKLAEKNRMLSWWTGLFCVLAALAIHYMCPVLLPWSLDNALFAMAFLEAGKQIRANGLVEKTYEKKWPSLLILTAFWILARLNGSINMSVGNYGKYMLMYVAVGVLGSFLCLELSYFIERQAQKGDSAAEALLRGGERIGQNSLRVLCLHLFVFMLVRTAAGFVPYIGTDGPFLKILMILAGFLVLVPGSLQGKLKILLWTLLLTWYLPLIDKGIDVQDTCFYLVNYRYIFQPDIAVNELYYLFAEVLGGIVYRLFPGHELLALNYTCAAVYTGTAMLIYRKLKDELPQIPLLLCLLAGSMYAVTWVHCVNWNAWSALFVTIGAWILLLALERESGKLLAAAGFWLGLNAFVRMPNILFLSLVVVVFWKNFLSGKKIAGSLKSCLPMVLGGVLAGVVGVLISLGLLGPDKFTEDMLVLTSLSAEGDLHSVTTGIYQFLVGLKDGILMWLRFGLVLLIPVLLLGKFRKGKWEKAVLAGGMLAAAVFGFIKGWNEDILQIQTFTAAAGIFLCGVAALTERKRDLRFSCLCLAAMIIEGFLTIGTDTAAIYYRIYMGLPLAMTVCIIWRWSISRPQWRMYAVFALAFVLAGGMRYANTYIYHDGAREKLTETVNSSVFTGVYTTKERAECLDRLEKQLEPYGDYELVTIGNFTAAQAMTDMKPFFRSSWPDLDYLTDSLFEETLETKLAQGIWPVVVIASEEVNGPYWMPEKVEILKELTSKAPYKKIYEDQLYSLYVPESEG